MADNLVSDLLDAALERRRMVFEVLSWLVPYDLPGERKVRIGAQDRGWVLVDRMRPAQPVVSFGNETSGTPGGFERAMSERGHNVWVIAPTTAAAAHVAGITHVREGLAGHDDPARALFSLESHLARLPAGSDAPIIKLDLGGGEWEALVAAPEALLARAEQLALAIHFNQQLGSPAFNAQVQAVLGKLCRGFTLCHVRADPLTEIRVLGGFPVLAALELTWIRSDLVERAPSATLYPTPLDRSTDLQQWPEQLLWFFPFAPGSAAGRLPDDLEVRAPALPASSTDSVALNNSGLALHGLNRLHEALRHFDRALELAPAEPGIHYNRGNTLVAMQRLEEAVAAYDAALAARPDDIGILNNRACALGGLNRFVEALASLDHAARLAPADATTLANREVVQRALASAGGS